MSDQSIRVLTIASDAADTRRIETLLAGSQPAIAVTSSAHLSHGLDLAAATVPDVILIDHALIGSLSQIRVLAPNTPLIVIGGADNEAEGKEADRHAGTETSHRSSSAGTPLPPNLCLA